MSTAPEQLRAFVERIERLSEEIKALNDDKRDVYAEAKGNGFDVKALKVVIARRAKDADDLSEFDAIVETYEAALGTAVATRAPAGAPEAVRPVPIRKIPDDEGIPDFLDRRARAS